MTPVPDDKREADRILTRLWRENDKRLRQENEQAEGVCPNGHPCYVIAPLMRACRDGEYVGYRIGMLP